MDFILRRITSQGKESNQIIGNNYSLIQDDRRIAENGKTDESDKTPLYADYLDCIEKSSVEAKDVRAFIIPHQTLEIIPVYCKSNYYIMTESGQTFSKIKAAIAI